MADLLFNIIRMIKQAGRNEQGMQHASGGKKFAQTFGKSSVLKRPLGGCRHRWKVNIKNDIKRI